MTSREKSYPPHVRSFRSTLKSIIFLASLTVFSQAGAVHAYDNGKVTMQWQANPPEEQVVGYKLYYGGQSRYNKDGSLKSDFSYDYFIDLAESLRCKVGDVSDCELLAADELSCAGLTGSSPQCTLAYLEGTQHLTLTAFSASKESGYTSEVTIVPAVVPSPGQPAPPPVPGRNGGVLPSVYKLLLL